MAHGDAIVVIVITAVRGVPDRKELDAAQGGELPRERGRGLHPHRVTRARPGGFDTCR